jgi:simple sugar transport system permease protein
MFSASQFNLAGEGSVMLGGFIGALCAIYLDMPGWIHPVVCVLIGSAVSGLIMLIPALLKVKLGASELVTSLMLNYIIMFIVLHFLNFNFADRSKGATQTFPFQPTAQIPALVEGSSKLSWGFIVALIFVVIVALFMYRTKWGYAIRMIGINQPFSKYSGMKVGATIVLSQVIGGILSGMGGSIEVLGRYNTYLWRELPGYGWTGITIAILAKNNPIFVPFAAFFIAYLNKGCQLMATYSDVPSEMIDIIQAAIFLFFAAEQFLAKYRQKIVVKNSDLEMGLNENNNLAQERSDA